MRRNGARPVWSGGKDRGVKTRVLPITIYHAKHTDTMAVMSLSATTKHESDCGRIRSLKDCHYTVPNVKKKYLSM